MLRALRPRVAAPAAAQERVSQIVPTGWIGDQLPLSQQAGWAVGDAGALSLPAFLRGVAIRSELVASLPLRWVVDGDVQEVTPPVLEQPDPSEDRSVTLKRLLASKVMRGNGFALLGAHDDLGFPQAMRVVHPDQVGWRQGVDGQGAYTLAGRAYDPSMLLHVRGTVLAGEPFGVSPIEACRRSLAGVASAEEYGRRYFQDGGLPVAVVKIDRPREQVDVGELGQLKAKWMAQMRGSREPLFVPADISLEPVTISNEDSQFLETRAFGILDVANIVGVPGYFLGAPSSPRTYQNIQDEKRILLDFYLRDDLYSLERAFTALLPAGEAKFDTDSFLRLDSKGTAELMRLEGAWMDIDELRAIKRLPPLPDGRGQVLAAPASGSLPVEGDADGDGAGATRAARLLQQVYLAVTAGLISEDEARALANKVGAGLTGPAPQRPEPGGGQ